MFDDALSASFSPALALVEGLAWHQCVSKSTSRAPSPNVDLEVAFLFPKSGERISGKDRRSFVSHTLYLKCQQLLLVYYKLFT